MYWENRGFGSHVDLGLILKSRLTSYAIWGKAFFKPASLLTAWEQ